MKGFYMGAMRKKLFIMCMITVCAMELTVPDIAKASKVTKGNTIGNLDCGVGYIIQDNDWLYMKNVGLQPAIYKVKKDGSERRKITLSGNCFGTCKYNLVDGWIYYTKSVLNADSGRLKNYICKRKTGGGKEIRLCSTKGCFSSPNGTGSIYVYNNWIYFIEHNGYDNYYLYRMKTDGTKKTAIVKRPHTLLMSFCIDGQWLYYIAGDGLYKVKLDGTSKKCLRKGRDFQICDVYGSWIYYLVDKNVYKVKKDGSKHQKFISNVNDFNINDGWVYYDSSKGLCKMKLDETSKKTLVKIGTVLHTQINQIGRYSILDNRIYFEYRTIVEMGQPFYRASVNTDGTDLRFGWWAVQNTYYGEEGKPLVEINIDGREVRDKQCK